MQDWGGDAQEVLHGSVIKHTGRKLVFQGLTCHAGSGSLEGGAQEVLQGGVIKCTGPKLMIQA